MPSQTPRQHRAMEAAAHGRGKIGIPPKVAKEFVAADTGKPAPKTSNIEGRQRLAKLMTGAHGYGR